MAEITYYRIHIEVPNKDGNVDVRGAVNLFVRVVKAVDEYSWFSSTDTKINIQQPVNVPTKLQIQLLFKNRTIIFRGSSYVVLYIKVHTRAISGGIKKVNLFKFLSLKGVRAWKEVWHTEPYRKVGWLSHVHPTLHWMDGIHDTIHQGVSSLIREGYFENKGFLDFMLQTERISFGNGNNRIKDECVVVVTSDKNAIQPKQNMASLYNDDTMLG